MRKLVIIVSFVVASLFIGCDMAPEPTNERHEIKDVTKVYLNEDNGHTCSVIARGEDGKETAVSFLYSGKATVIADRLPGSQATVVSRKKIQSLHSDLVIVGSFTEEKVPVGNNTMIVLTHRDK